MNPAKVLHLRSGTRLFGPERVILGLGHYASPEFPPIVGGIERGDAPSLMLQQAAAEGLATFRLPCRGRLDFGAIKRLADFLKTEQIGILHAHDFKANFYALAARRKYPLPLVTTLHLWNRNNFVTAIYECLDALLVRRFDRIIGVSPAIVAEAKRWHIPEEKLRVILNGIDVARFQKIPPRPADGKIVIGSVGRLVAQKGYPIFLQMAAALLAKNRHLQFLLVGDGPVRGELEAEAKNLGLGEKVIFAGQRDPVETAYGEMDIFVSSSLSEGLPIALLEAMAARLPVVATRVGAVAEVIEDEVSGLLVEAGNPQVLIAAVESLLADPTKKQALAEGGFRRVQERFSAENMARQTEAVYREILHG
jgi:glycosyltransferase involved in cell wall biosynthesis